LGAIASIVSTIFLTGATGFVGGHFARTAIAAGHTVKALRRANSHCKLQLAPEPEWIEGELSEVQEPGLRGCDVLVHLASKGSSPQQVSWQDAFQINVLDSLSLWRKAAAAGVRRFVIAGSGLEYGVSAYRYDPIPADAPLEPLGNYALSKATSSIYARAFCWSERIELVYVRMFNLYGEGQFDGNFYPAMCNAARSGQDFKMTSGTQVRDFDRVENAANALLKWVDCDQLHAGNPVFVNHGSGKPRTLAEYANAWWRELSAPGKLLVGALPDRVDEVRIMRPDLNPIECPCAPTRDRS
jgi:UDP-glucose 4-epimerase